MSLFCSQSISATATPVTIRRDFGIQTCYAELRCERMRERNDSRYEQFLKISPETIEQELRPVDCEQCQTDLRRIGMKSKHECAVQKKPNKITSFATWVHP